jgi:hypothetical protein
MSKDKKKFHEIARVCAILSKYAATPDERDMFAALANKWQKFATDAEACPTPRDEDSDPKKDKSASRAVRGH